MISGKSMYKVWLVLDLLSLRVDGLYSRDCRIMLFIVLTMSAIAYQIVEVAGHLVRCQLSVIGSPL